MIAASFVVAFGIGCVCGRLYSYVALLMVSPLLAAVVAMLSWRTGAGVPTAALVGVGAMALSQIGFLVGVTLDPRFGAGRRAPGASLMRPPKRTPVKRPPSSAPKR